VSGENHEMTELELYRKDVVNKENTIELLKNNIAEMQGQIQKGYIRIKELVEEKDKLQEENDNLKKQLGT
tara:strand:- start:185 stop:394 length:210 start_codon:yes stop_codon:yes gene_type:complete